MKRLTFSLCVAALTIFASAASAEILIKFSHVVSADTPKGRGAEIFKAKVDERLAGLAPSIDTVSQSSDESASDVAAWSPVRRDIRNNDAPEAETVWNQDAPSDDLLDLELILSDDLAEDVLSAWGTV